jgi:hypothetical protein
VRPEAIIDAVNKLLATLDAPKGRKKAKTDKQQTKEGERT